MKKFLKLLPHDSKAALKVARKHGKKVEGREFLEVKSDFPLRHAFEFRHKSFLNQDFTDLLRKHNVAFVFAHEGGEKVPYTEMPTANFVYARLHGGGKKYAKGYADKEISAWAKKVEGWNKKGIETFVYLSNEAKEYSPASALKLTKKLGIARFETKKKAA